MRPLVFLAASAALVALVVLGLSQTHSSNATPRNSAPSAAEIRAAFAGSPAPLAALHADGARLLDVGGAGVRARLAALRGYPYVVNKWASWCAPCRAEFPFLQRASVDLGRRMGFVGLDGADNAGDARSFLRRFPLSYPSFADPSERIARSLGIANVYPETLFVDAAGRTAYVHQGGYATEALLRRDIGLYLGVS